MTVRLIPRLDIKGPNLVKGVHLEGLRVLGKPDFFASTYYAEGADELIYMDIVASLYGRNNLKDIVRVTAESIYIPLTVGGGLRTIADIQQILRVGADKVAINTAAIRNPQLITESAKTFGSQCIVVSIEAKKMNDGRYLAFTDNGREPTGVEVFGWAKKAEALGAGELLITSIDNEGTGKGYDLELVATIAKSVSIPVIACGGAGSVQDLEIAVKQGCADAVCAASLFHYDLLGRADYAGDWHADFKEEGNVSFLQRAIEARKYKGDTIHTAGVATAKAFLQEKDLAIRH